MLPAIVGLMVGIAIGACLAVPIARYRIRLAESTSADYGRQVAAATREVASACRSIDAAVCNLSDMQAETCRQMARVADRLERR